MGLERNCVGSHCRGALHTHDASTAYRDPDQVIRIGQGDRTPCRNGRVTVRPCIPGLAKRRLRKYDVIEGIPVLSYFGPPS